MENNSLINVSGLSVEFPLSGNKKVHAVSNVSFDIKEKEVLALVGESGCGKSTLGKSIIRLLEPTAGEVSFKGEVITGLSPKAFQHYRRQMQIVFRKHGAAVADVENQLDLWDIVNNLFNSADEFRAEHQTVRVGKIQTIADFFRRIAEIERNCKRAGFQRAEINRQPLDAVHHKYGNLVAFFDAAAD